ncbi:hypothetical protein P5673_032859 [Acropora cervicornis]|uniref:Uncharacterized protein n=1 Tax=Acropora cervicornis TaxID=6130 RepID=A0AAD9PQR3_ACRCE|nr:hypothetical protein P5673_032859 [Acropora cervicornis]
MQLSPAAKEELRWWCDNVGHGYRRIQHASHSHSFQVDASDSDWGIACTTDESLQSHGFWSQEQRSFHINKSKDEYIFILSKHVKQSRPNYPVPPVIIPRYTPDEDICPLLYQLEN